MTAFTQDTLLVAHTPCIHLEAASTIFRVWFDGGKLGQGCFLRLVKSLTFGHVELHHELRKALFAQPLQFANVHYIPVFEGDHSLHEGTEVGVFLHLLPSLFDLFLPLLGGGVRNAKLAAQELIGICGRVAVQRSRPHLLLWALT